MEQEKINKAANKLMLRKITHKWVSTDMGSGYKFQLLNPYQTVVWDEVLENQMYLDLYDGVDEEDGYSKTELEQHFQDWKDGLFKWAFKDFLALAKEKHSHLFQEFVLDAIEMSDEILIEEE